MHTLIRLVPGFALALGACQSPEGSRVQADSVATADSFTAAALAEFDTLDFVVFSGQQWDRLQESHAQDIVVHWPDGHTTTGIDKHIEDLKAMFVYAPDTRILEHPIRVGSGEWTAVTGVMTGTFSQPMPLGGGKVAQPTGKKFSLPMATFGRWRGGVMVEEYLFWDNQAYLRQIGLGN